jgi:hypothetical protein
MRNQPAAEQIEAKYRSLSPLMDERMRRQWAAAESRAYGWGGVDEQTGEMLYKTDRRHGLHHGGEQLAFPALA